MDPVHIGTGQRRVSAALHTGSNGPKVVFKWCGTCGPSGGASSAAGLYSLVHLWGP